MGTAAPGAYRAGHREASHGRLGTDTEWRSPPGTGGTGCLGLAPRRGHPPASRHWHRQLSAPPLWYRDRVRFQLACRVGPAGRAPMTGHSPVLGTERAGGPESPGRSEVGGGSRHPPTPAPRWGRSPPTTAWHLQNMASVNTVTTHGCPGALVAELTAHHFKPLLEVGCAWPPVLYCS